MSYTAEARMTLYAGHSRCQHWAEEGKRNKRMHGEHSALHLILNNGDFNKMRHKGKKSNGFVNIKKRCCGREKSKVK